MTSTKELVETGDIAPDFRLPSTMGEVSPADYIGRRGVVLYFIREFGCMTCQMHAASLVKAYSDIRDAGFEVLVVGGGSETDALTMARRIKPPFPIVADRERSVYEQYGVDKAFYFVQRSATFVVDIDGRVVYSHRATSPAGGLNLAGIMSTVRYSSSVRT